MNVTYADLFQFCMFIVALIGLCYQIFKNKKSEWSILLYSDEYCRYLIYMI